MNRIPVIDLFAGPGGLSEGFSRYDARRRYRVALSIEKDPVACQTLRLRAYTREFKDGEFPPDYYDFLAGNKTALARIQASEQWARATEHVRQWELGKTDANEVHRTIHAALGGRHDWLLLGGPPCQAFSLMGRSRMTGAGVATGKAGKAKKAALEAAFADDHRHRLYLEYLKIIAVHSPAVFVMENVEGILSAKLPMRDQTTGKITYKPAIDQICRDLAKPRRAPLGSDDGYRLDKFVKRYGTNEHTYTILSFVEKVSSSSLDDRIIDGRRFLIRSEEFGIPQERHRVILLGVRDDIKIREFNLLVPAKRVSVGDMIGDLPRIRSIVSNRDKMGSRKAGSEMDWPTAVAAVYTRTVKQNLDKRVRNEIDKLLKKLDPLEGVGGSFIKGKFGPRQCPKPLRDFISAPALKGVVNHEARGHMPADLGRYLFVATFGKLEKKSPPLEAWPRSLLPKHKNIAQDIKQKRKLRFNDRFRVLLEDQPSKTVTSHLSKDGHMFIHYDPTQCRSLTVREAARLQTFPDDYFFCGPPTEQRIQVGNAVPPYLAFQLAGVVSQLFDTSRKR